MELSTAIAPTTPGADAARRASPDESRTAGGFALAMERAHEDAVAPARSTAAPQASARTRPNATAIGQPETRKNPEPALKLGDPNPTGAKPGAKLGDRIGLKTGEPTAPRSAEKSAPKTGDKSVDGGAERPSAQEPASDPSAETSAEPARDPGAAAPPSPPPDQAQQTANPADFALAPVGLLPAGTAPSAAAQQIEQIALALGLVGTASGATPSHGAQPAAALAAAPAALPASGLLPAALGVMALATDEFAELVSTPLPAAATAPSTPPAATGLAALAPPAPAAPALPALSTPPGQPGFAQEFGERILMLSQGAVKSALIALNPGDLGPVDVRLDLRGQEASLLMSAAHPATRAALEDSLPRLREMFAAQGLTLTEAEVGTRDGSGPAFADPRRAGSSRSGAADETPHEAPVHARAPRGLVDTFA